MSVTLHWFLPTSGDARTVLGALGEAGAHHRRASDAGERPADIAYLGQIARAAEHLGFEAVLTPTGSWCEDAWLVTAALSQVTERLKFLVAFRPGLISPTLAAQMAGDLPAAVRRAPAAQRRHRRRPHRAGTLRGLPRQGRALPPHGRVPHRRARRLG
jgi:hypothetical protein